MSAEGGNSSKHLICLLMMVFSLNMAQGTITFYHQDGSEDAFTEKGLASNRLYIRSKGYVHAGDPSDGCHLPIPVPAHPDPSHQWFLLLDGNNCDAETKVSNAQDSGFPLVLLEDPSNCTSPKLTIVPEIAVLFITSSTFKKILDDFADKNVSVQISCGIQELGWYIVVAFVLVALFVIIVFSGAYLYHRHADGVPRYQGSGELCTICYQNLVRGQRMRQLYCTHLFHMDCFGGWYSIGRRTCPLCRQSVDGITETTPLLSSSTTN